MYYLRFAWHYENKHTHRESASSYGGKSVDRGLGASAMSAHRYQAWVPASSSQPAISAWSCRRGDAVGWGTALQAGRSRVRFPTVIGIFHWHNPSGRTMAPRSTQPLTEMSRGQLKCDGTRAETRFRLSAKRKSPFKSAGASVQSTTGSRGVRISGSNAGYTVFRGSVKGTGYPLHSPVSPSLPLPCVTVCHHISAGVYQEYFLGGKGGRCVGLTNLPPSCADCLEIWEPQPPGTLRACPGLYIQGLVCLCLFDVR